MKTYFFFALLISYFGFGQGYDFDYRCLSESHRIKPKTKEKDNNSEVYLLLSSKHPLVYGKRYTKTNSLNIFDYEIDKILNIVNKYGKYEVFSARDISRDSNEFEIEKTSVTKMGEFTYLVMTFPNKKTRRSNLEVIFTVRKSDFPLVKILFMDLSPEIHENVYNYLLKALPDDHYQIDSANVNYRNGYQFLYKWSKCEKANFKMDFKPIETK